MSKFTRSLMAIFVISVPACARPSVKGIDNFYQVGANVYRGGQPTPEGFKYLARLGLKNVLDLREQGRRSAEEAQLVTALGMHYVNVPMTGFAPPTEAQVTKILALLEDPNSGGVFVHCRRGADRTGAVIAAYRIDHDHWDNSRALKEAMSCGMSFFQWPRQSYIRNFHARTNVENAQSVNGPSEPAKLQSIGIASTVAAPQP